MLPTYYIAQIKIAFKILLRELVYDQRNTEYSAEMAE